MFPTKIFLNLLISKVTLTDRHISRSGHEVFDIHNVLVTNASESIVIETWKVYKQIRKYDLFTVEECKSFYEFIFDQNKTSSDESRGLDQMDDNLIKIIDQVSYFFIIICEWINFICHFYFIISIIYLIVGWYSIWNCEETVVRQPNSKQKKSKWLSNG